MSLSSRAARLLAVLGLLTISGCVSTGAPGPDAAGTDFPVLSVDGVEPCSSLTSDATDPPAGSDVPDLPLRCLTDRANVNLAEVTGTPTVVNLWASWCGPCREEMPLLASTYLESGDSVRFVGIDIRDNPPAAAALLKETSVTYPQLVDPAGDFLARLRVPGLPVTLAVDEQGRIVDRQVGPVDRERLAELMAAATGS